MIASFRKLLFSFFFHLLIRFTFFLRIILAGVLSLLRKSSQDYLRLFWAIGDRH